MKYSSIFTEKRRKAPCFSSGDIRCEIPPAMRGVYYFHTIVPIAAEVEKTQRWHNAAL